MFVDWRVPNDSRRVCVVVAKVPAAEVADIYTVPSWLDDSSSAHTAGPD
jgi:hypothetical protein